MPNRFRFFLKHRISKNRLLSVVCYKGRRPKRFSIYSTCMYVRSYRQRENIIKLPIRIIHISKDKTYIFIYRMSVLERNLRTECTDQPMKCNFSKGHPVVLQYTNVTLWMQSNTTWFSSIIIYWRPVMVWQTVFRPTLQNLRSVNTEMLNCACTHVINY